MFRNSFDVDKCAVCLGDFEHPKILECRHIFCLECIRKCKSFRSVCCPLCRQPTQVTCNDLDCLPSPKRKQVDKSTQTSPGLQGPENVTLSEEATNAIQKACSISKLALQKLLCTETERPVRDFALFYLDKTVQTRPLLREASKAISFLRQNFLQSTSEQDSKNV